MCFSAQASFVASAGLFAIGLLASKLARTPLQRIAALTPLFFAAQQAIEGYLWIALPQSTGTTSLVTLAMYAYLAIALIFWPTWIPGTLWYYERNTSRKLALGFLLLSGIGYAAYMLYLLCIHGAHALIVYSHISYVIPIPATYYYPLTTLYCAATLLPMFVSSLRYFWIIGLATTISMLLSYHYYYCCFASVWCFFAAIISVLILLVIHLNNKKSRA